MLHDRSIIVVVPAYQEEAHITHVIETMPTFVDRIIVVDDGSSDRTSIHARAATPSNPKASIELLRHPVRRGVGAAIATGYVAALQSDSEGGTTEHDQDVIAVMAGDGQMHPDDLLAVVSPIAEGRADYVKGDRFGHATARRAMGFPRWLGGQVFSRLTALAIGQEISDSQCGYTALSRRAGKSLDLKSFWPSFGYPNDLLGQLAARQARIVEVPVRPLYGSEISKLRLRHLPPIFFLIGRAAARRARSGRKTPLHPTPNPTRPDPTKIVAPKDDVEKKELRSSSPVSS